MKPCRRTAVLAFALLPALLLGGCDLFGGSSADSGDGATSSEVLEGSISDDMIPTDTVTSQPPLLGVQPGEGGAAGEAEATEGDPAAEGEVAETASEAEPAAPEAAAE